jgi:hypothetical protein
MRYWKRTDTEGTTTTVEAYSHSWDVEGATEIGQREYDAFVSSCMDRRPSDEVIDRQTADKINSQVHSTTPIEDQIGILRAQLVHTLNALGVKPTPEFAAFNELVVKEIEAAQERKVSDAKD